MVWPTLNKNLRTILESIDNRECFSHRYPEFCHNQLYTVSRSGCYRYCCKSSIPTWTAWRWLGTWEIQGEAMEKQERFPMPPNRHQNNNQTHLKGLTYLLSKCNLKSHNTSQSKFFSLIQVTPSFTCKSAAPHLSTLDTTSQGKSTHQKSAPIRQRKKCSLKNRDQHFCALPSTWFPTLALVLSLG